MGRVSDIQVSLVMGGLKMWWEYKASSEKVLSKSKAAGCRLLHVRRKANKHLAVTASELGRKGMSNSPYWPLKSAIYIGATWMSLLGKSHLLFCPTQNPGSNVCAQTLSIEQRNVDCVFVELSNKILNIFQLASIEGDLIEYACMGRSYSVSHET